MFMKVSVIQQTHTQVKKYTTTKEKRHFGVEQNHPALFCFFLFV